MSDKSIYFIDPGVQDYGSLIAALPANSEWYLLDGGQDGIEQMAAILQNHSNLGSIQIISHGAEGTLYLGSTVLDSSNLEIYQSQLQQIGSALCDKGDILLYGCNVAAGEIGQNFISCLALATDADVAASADLTGSTIHGGDWILEQSTGQVDAVAITAWGYQELLGSLYDNINFDLSTFVDLAILSKAAYSHDLASLNGLVSAAGWDFADQIFVTQLVNVSDIEPLDAHVIMATREINGKMEMVISFEGTRGGILDPDWWETNLSSWGFCNYYMALRPTIETWIHDAILGEYDKIYLTGHSLGGAAAQIAMLDMCLPGGIDIWEPVSLGAGPLPLSASDRNWLTPAEKAYLQHHLFGATFGAPSISIDPPNFLPTAEKYIINSAFGDLSEFKNILFQFEHKANGLDDPVANLGSTNVDNRGDELGTMVPLDLVDAVRDRYKEFSVIDLHSLDAYQESLLRMLRDSTIISSAGNDIFVFSASGTYAVNGGSGHDVYVIKDYGINLTISGPAGEKLDSLYFNLLGPVTVDAISNSSEDLTIRITAQQGVSTVTILNWYSPTNTYQLSEIVEANPFEFSYWTAENRSFSSLDVPLFNIGTSGDDDLILGSLSGDLMNGNSGKDVMKGRAGNDSINGGDGLDTAVYQYAVGNLLFPGIFSGYYEITRHGDVVTITAKAPLTEGTDTLHGVEFLKFADRTINVKLDLPDLSVGTVSGGNVSDGGIVLGGGSSSNEGSTSGTAQDITNWVGNDNDNVLNGGNGKDVFIGQGGNDIFTGYSGQDYYDGGSGSDTVDYSYNPASVTGNINLAAGTAYFPGYFTEELIRIENVWMGASNDQVIGDNGNNDLRGGPGNDILQGGLGNDVIYGDWKFSDNGGIDKAILSYTFGSGYTVSGSANALHIIGTEGDDWYYNVENFQFAGSVIKSAAAVLNIPEVLPIVVPPPNINPIFLSILDSSVREGTGGGLTNMTFKVLLTGPGAGAQIVSVSYNTEVISGGSSRADGFDFVSTVGTLYIPVGQTSGSITIPIQPDTVFEPDETFGVRLSAPSSNVTINNNFGTGTIFNDDAVPNRFPLTKPDNAITAPNTQVAIDVLANDIDPDGDTPLRVISIGYQSAPGTITIGVDGSNILFTPGDGTTGSVFFYFSVQDARGAFANSFATVIIAGDGTPGITNPGTDANDTITGTSGNDILSGGIGNDTIAGGPGADRIDGGPGFDFLDLREAAHKAYINFQLQGELGLFQDDGDGGWDIFTNIEGVLGSAFDDEIDVYHGVGNYRLYGNDGNDILQSRAGSDLLDGGAGNDILKFGAGQDIVFGGTGNDKITVGSITDPLSDILDGGDGSDVIEAFHSLSSDDVRGGNGNDFLEIGYNDFATGGSGSDIFWIATGYYRFYPEYFSDIYSSQQHATITDFSVGEEIRWTSLSPIIFYDGIPPGPQALYFIGPITHGVGLTTAQNHVEYSTASGETRFFFGFDATPGAEFILTLTGTFALDGFHVNISNTSESEFIMSYLPADQFPVAQYDTITVQEDTPGNGNLLVDNGLGMDSDPNGGLLTINAINGASANIGQMITLATGALLVVNVDGRFVYDPNGKFENLDVGQTASDSFTYTIIDDQGLTSTATVSITITGALDGIRVTGGSGTINGTSVDDKIAGGLGNEIIHGLAGFDWLQGGSGTDMLFGESGSDWLEGGPDLDTLDGGADDDILLGGRGYDDLRGGSGNDYLEGGLDKNLMTGGLGNDTYVVHRGDGDGLARTGTDEDKVVESLNEGTDTVESHVYSYLLPTNVENLVLAGQFALKGFGNGLDNRISGNNANNLLAGGAGNDVLLGEAGNDQLTGGSGNDVLDGGAGVDILTGGLGQDKFEFNDLDSSDWVNDFSGGAGQGDKLQLSLSTFSGIGTVGNLIDAGTFKSGINPNATDADDHIIYNQQSGALFYDPDGNGIEAMIQFATLLGAPALTSTDIWVVA